MLIILRFTTNAAIGYTTRGRRAYAVCAGHVRRAGISNIVVQAIASGRPLAISSSAVAINDIDGASITIIRIAHSITHSHTVTKA